MPEQLAGPRLTWLFHLRRGLTRLRLPEVDVQEKMVLSPNGRQRVASTAQVGDVSFAIADVPLLLPSLSSRCMLPAATNEGEQQWQLVP